MLRMKCRYLCQRVALVVYEKVGMFVLSEYRRWVFGSDGAIERMVYRLSFGGARRHAVNAGGHHERGYGERDGALWHLFQPGKAAIVDLLPAAGGVELYLFDPFAVLKVRHMGIVECKMSVLTNAHEHDVGWVLSQKLRITIAFLLRIGCVAVDAMYRCKGHLVENAFAEEAGKGLRRLCRQPYVFVHVERVDLPPGDRPVRDQGCQKLVLGRSCGKYDIDAVLCAAELF